jgi:hypothetical protein
MIRRITIGALTLLLAVSVIGWIVYMPPSALNTLRPVPAHAQIVYQNRLPVRSDLEKLPFCRDWKNMDRFFQSLGKSPLTVAVVPLGGRERRDAWVVVSALGSRAPWLRWRMVVFPPAGVKAVRSYGAWPVWEYNDSAFPAWMRVRFSVGEGLLICSISDDSHDLYYLLDTLDGRRPSAERKEMP